MHGSQIKVKLRSGERVYGTHIASLMNPMAAAMAARMDLDFAFFCTEHMPIDRTEVSMLCQFYAAHGISPIVRVPSPDASAISMALDGGAEGIVVPYVETPEEVRLISGAVKYRPIKGALLRKFQSGAPVPEKTRAFLEDFNRGHYLIIGIESMAAIERLEELVGAGEVDGVFLGPHDISATMDLPNEYSHPEFLRVVEDVIRRCRRLNVGVGLHTQYFRMEEVNLRRFLDAGMNWLINGSDIGIMVGTLNDQLRRLRAFPGPKDAPQERSGPVATGVKSCIA